MAFFYVKNGGNGTLGSQSSALTGAFPNTTAYASVAAALTAGASGHIIVVSNAHTETGTGFVATSPTTLVTVDASNCENKVTATSNMFTGADCEFEGSWEVHGIKTNVADDVGATNAAGSNVVFFDCDLGVTGAGDATLSAYSDGTYVRAVRCILRGISTSDPVKTLAMGSVELVECTTVGMTSHLTDASFINAGGYVRAYACDFSSITGTLLKDIGADSTADDAIDVIISGCKLNASVAFSNENFTGKAHRLKVINSASSSAVAEYQFHIKGPGGYAENQADSGIHRDESTAFSSGAKVSAKCVTNTAADFHFPFWFELPARVAEFGTGGVDTVRIYLASTASLTDIDVWAELVYPDGTNGHEFHYLSTKNANPLATSGTALTTDSGSTWKDGASDLTGYTEYYIDIDTSGDPGGDCVPYLRIFVGKPSTTIYFDTTVDIV